MTIFDPSQGFEEIQVGAPSLPLILVCDHAGQFVPADLPAYMGLNPQQFDDHIAWDIGAAALTRMMSARLQVPAVLSTYSRLFIDCNRALEDETSIIPVSDGIVIPANQGLTLLQRQDRQTRAFFPYHDRIDQLIGRFRRTSTPLFLLSIHSFTPQMDGFRRPWPLGILWNRDARAKDLAFKWLTQNYPDWPIGDNQPYSAQSGPGYTLDRHAEVYGFPHLLIEVRQDLIADEGGVMRMTEVLAPMMVEIVSTLISKG